MCIFTCNTLHEANVPTQIEITATTPVFQAGCVQSSTLLINVPMHLMYCLQRFLHRPGDLCEVKGLMPRLSWRPLSPVRLNPLLKAQTVPRQTVHACLQVVAYGALISLLSMPFAFPPPPNALKFSFQEHMIFLPQYIYKENARPVCYLPYLKPEVKLPRWHKTIFCNTQKDKFQD